MKDSHLSHYSSKKKKEDKPGEGKGVVKVVIVSKLIFKTYLSTDIPASCLIQQRLNVSVQKVPVITHPTQHLS